MGTRCGFKTLMVLTGVNSEDDIKKWQASDSQDDKDLIANLYAPSIHDLLPYMD